MGGAIIFLALNLIFAAISAAGTIVRDPAAPDPILTGALDPCLESSGYTAGISTTGESVAPADLPTAAPPLAGNVVIAHQRPIGSPRDVEVPVDLAALAPPPCGALAHAARRR